MSRLVALLVGASLLAGCAGAPRAKMIGGTGLALGGAMIAAHRADGHCSDEANGLCDQLVSDPINAGVNAVTTVLGVGMILIGGGLLVSGMREEDDEERAALVPVARVEVPRPRPVVVVVTEPGASPADLALRERVENRLAIQASLAAKTGNCESALATANALAARDPDLHGKLLAADDALRACYSQSVQRM